MSTHSGVILGDPDEPDHARSPRFPQPLLERLADELMSWRSVLSLTSVDRREAPMRQFWINTRSVVLVDRVQSHGGSLGAFVARFPQCAVKQTIRRDDDEVLMCTSRLVVDIDYSDTPRRLPAGRSVSLHELTLSPSFAKSTPFMSSLASLTALTHLTFGRGFTRTLDNVVLPPRLTHLVFGTCFDQPLNAVDLPASLTHLTLGHSFSRSLECIRLLPALTHLTLGRYVSTKPVVLPLSVTHLTLDGCFNEPLDNFVLPPSLTHLTLSLYFNQPLSNVALPASLTHVTFGREFNQPLDALVDLPRLRIVRVGYRFRQSVPPAIVATVRQC